MTIANPDGSINISREAFRSALQSVADAIVDEVFKSMVPPSNDDIFQELSRLVRLDIVKMVASRVPQGQEKYRRGVEIHAKLRRAKKDLDRLDPSKPEVIALRDDLHKLTNEVLKKYFDTDIADTEKENPNG